MNLLSTGHVPHPADGAREFSCTQRCSLHPQPAGCRRDGARLPPPHVALADGAADRRADDEANNQHAEHALHGSTNIVADAQPDECAFVGGANSAADRTEPGADARTDYGIFGASDDKAPDNEPAVACAASHADAHVEHALYCDGGRHRPPIRMLPHIAQGIPADDRMGRCERSSKLDAELAFHFSAPRGVRDVSGGRGMGALPDGRIRRVYTDTAPRRIFIAMHLPARFLCRSPPRPFSLHPQRLDMPMGRSDDAR